MRARLCFLAAAGLGLPAAAHALPSPPAAQATPAAERRQERPPRETVTATLDGKKVTVEYGRPALAGRTVDELMAQLPADRVWRAGVNQVTTLRTETDLVIGDTRVPAGSYSLYVHLPAEGPASLIVNSDPGIALKVIFPKAPPELADALWPRLDGYDKVKDKEVARVPLASAPAREAAADRFLITLEPAEDGVSALTLAWGDRAWTTSVRPAS